MLQIDQQLTKLSSWLWWHTLLTRGVASEWSTNDDVSLWDNTQQRCTTVNTKHRNKETEAIILEASATSSVHNSTAIHGNSQSGLVQFSSDFRDAPIRHWPIISRLTIGAQQLADIAD